MLCNAPYIMQHNILAHKSVFSIMLMYDIVRVCAVHIG